MKKLLFLLILLQGGLLTSQTYLYFPNKTFHFTEIDGQPYVNGEGGDIGVIISHRVNNKSIDFGLVRNSFGEKSYVLGHSYYFDYGKFSYGMSYGLMSGYKKIFSKKKVIKLPMIMGKEVVFEDNLFIEKYLPQLFIDNGIMPYVSTFCKVQVYKNLGLQINVSPIYVNVGLYLKLKNI